MHVCILEDIEKNFKYLGHSLLREPERGGNCALRITFDVEALSHRENLPRRKVSVEMCPAF